MPHRVVCRVCGYIETFEKEKDLDLSVWVVVTRVGEVVINGEKAHRYIGFCPRHSATRPL